MTKTWGRTCLIRGVVEIILTVGGNYLTSKTLTQIVLYSASTAALIVPATRHSTLGDRAFPVIGARLWNSLPDDITLSLIHI